MDDEKVEQAIQYSHDVGFDEGYEVVWQEGYDAGLADAKRSASDTATTTAPTGAVNLRE